jgi:uncharacterized membrane protein YeiH
MLDDVLIDSLDWIGVFVFAVSGAIAGAERRLDMFGVLTLAFVTAAAGGIVRDVLIGVVPPEAIVSWRPLAISLVGGLLGFWRPDWILKLRSPELVSDAAGLGVSPSPGRRKR